MTPATERKEVMAGENDGNGAVQIPRIWMMVGAAAISAAIGAGATAIYTTGMNAHRITTHEEHDSLTAAMHSQLIETKTRLDTHIENHPDKAIKEQLRQHGKLLYEILRGMPSISSTQESQGSM